MLTHTQVYTHTHTHTDVRTHPGHFTIRASRVITTTVIETLALQKHGHLETKETGKSCSEVIILNDWDLDRWKRGRMQYFKKTEAARKGN